MPKGKGPSNMRHMKGESKSGGVQDSKTTQEGKHDKSRGASGSTGQAKL